MQLLMIVAKVRMMVPTSSKRQALPFATKTARPGLRASASPHPRTGHKLKLTRCAAYALEKLQKDVLGLRGADRLSPEKAGASRQQQEGRCQGLAICACG